MNRIKKLWNRLTIGGGADHPLSRKMLVRTEADINRLQYLIDLIEGKA